MPPPPVEHRCSSVTWGRWHSEPWVCWCCRGQLQAGSRPGSASWWRGSPHSAQDWGLGWGAAGHRGQTRCRAQPRPPMWASPVLSKRGAQAGRHLCGTLAYPAGQGRGLTGKLKVRPQQNPPSPVSSPRALWGHSYQGRALLLPPKLSGPTFGPVRETTLVPAPTVIDRSDSPEISSATQSASIHLQLPWVPQTTHLRQPTSLKVFSHSCSYQAGWQLVPTV